VLQYYREQQTEPRVNHLGGEKQLKDEWTVFQTLIWRKLQSLTDDKSIIWGMAVG